MTDPHRIRIRGQWQVTARDCGGASSEAKNGAVIDSPSQWRDVLDSLSGKRSSQFIVVIRRSFNWAFPQPPPESVELVFDHVNCVASVFLNDKPLGQLNPHAAHHRFDLAGTLTVHNKLRLEIRGDALADSPNPFSDVSLEIR